jgi:hypothetical protein
MYMINLISETFGTDFKNAHAVTHSLGIAFYLFHKQKILRVYILKLVSRNNQRLK